MYHRRSPEECIAEDDIVDRVHAGIFYDVSIDEEEHREIDLFARSNFLLLKAEAFDFGKVRSNLRSARPSMRGTVSCKQARGSSRVLPATVLSALPASDVAKHAEWIALRYQLHQGFSPWRLRQLV